MHSIGRILLSWFGAGFSPWAPGTIGSAAALPFAWIIASYWGVFGLLLAALIIFSIGCILASIAQTESADPGWIVIDEVAGQWLTLCVVPPDLMLYGVGFLLFRAFDIVKPWPIRLLETRIPGALGIMVDDVAAALFSGSLLYIIYLGTGS